MAVTLGLYWMLVRKKKRESADWVPAALVRQYLDRVRSDEREIRIRLFGEDAASAAPVISTSLGAHSSGSVIVNSSDPALAREVEALRGQLSMADQRTMEFDRNMNALKAEKAALEQKLKEAQAAAAAGGGAAPAAGGGVPAPVQKELEDLKAKLQEYEVIEDDLANLKKFQKENEQLKQKLNKYEGGAPVETVVAAAPAAAEAVTKIAAAEAPAPELTVVKGSEPAKEPVTMTVIPGGGEASAAAPAATPAPALAEAPKEAPKAEVNTNVLQPVTPTVDTGAAPAAAAAADGSAKPKEEELLSEFEKMLAS